MTPRTISILSLWMILGLFSAVLAVGPEEWTHTSEADFDQAERDAVVVDSHGDVTLSRAVEVLLDGDDAPAVLTSIALGSDGEVFAGSGADGRIFRIADGESEEFCTIPATVVTTLRRRGKTLLVGGGGKDAGVYLVGPGGEIRELFIHPEVKYVWSILPLEGESLLAATGPKGKVYRVDGEGNAEVVYDAGNLAKNILCLTQGETQIVWAGTDQDGLVVELDLANGGSRVVLDAPEQEISDIVADGRGGFYASTADAAKSLGEIKPTGGKTGRPAGAVTPEQPEQDKQPQPVEGEDAEQPDDADPEQTPSAEADPQDRDAGMPADEAVADKNADEESSGKKKISGKIENLGGKLRVTLKEGQNLPKVTKNGKEYYLLPSPSGKIVGVPVEKVEIRRMNRTVVTPAPSGNGRSSGSSSAGGSKGGGDGNAVYHVDAEGVIRTLLRRPVGIYDMLLQGNRLVLGTGQEGGLHFVTTDGQMRGELLDTESKQIPAMVLAEDGAIYFVASNSGMAARLGPGFAAKGTLLSKPLDARQITQWGTLRLGGATPEHTAITIATRSGNLEDATDATWSDWSREIPLQDGYVPIGSPAARFLQYRVTMTSDGTAAPTLGRVNLLYQVVNLAPQIAEIEVQPSEKGDKAEALHKAFRLIQFKAGDPNKDKLVYTLEYRKADSRTWITLTDELTDEKFAWDTRTVEDGTYELRITASDKPSNIDSAALTARRLSEPVTVDNTAPSLTPLQTKREGKVVTISTRAEDAGRIVTMAYSIDGKDPWITLLPADGICDSTTETISFRTKALSPGGHRITIRVEDLYGNIVRAGVDVDIPKD